MTDYIKLTDAGSSVTFELRAVAVNANGKWPEYHLTTETGAVVSAPKAALDRQLAGCGVQTMEQLIGSYITYSRSEKLGTNGHPFHNLAVSSPGAAKQSATPSKRLAPPTKLAPPVVNAFDASVPPDDDIPLPPEPPELAPRRSATPNVSTATVGTDVERYAALMRDLAAKLECAVTEPNVQGAAATLWIQWHRR
jgi:hypothetical protein